MTSLNWVFLCAAVAGSCLGDTLYYTVRLERSPFIIGSGATDVLDDGTMVGSLYPTPDSPGGYYDRPFVYNDRDGFIEITNLPGSQTHAGGINTRGQICGSAYSHGEWRAFMYTPSGGYRDLGDLGETNNAAANAINSRGHVAGHASSPESAYLAFLYTESTGMTNLGTLGGEWSSADAINELSWITGYAEASNGMPHVFLYKPETGMVDLGEGFGRGINDHGWVVGDTLDSRIVLFKDGTVTVIAGPYWEAYGGDINNAGGMVGSIQVSRSSSYYSGYVANESVGLIFLDTVINTNSGLRIQFAYAINNHGQIAATDGGRAYRLDPIPPKLAIQPAGTNVVVSWSPRWPGLVLEAAESLSATNWQTLSTNFVTVPIDSPARFFRLNLEAIRGLCCAPEP